MTRRNRTAWQIVSIALMAAGITISTEAEQKTATSPKLPEKPTPKELQAFAAASMEKGLDWLKAQQQEDGAWSNEDYPAITALGLWAFTRSDHPDKKEVCEKAAKFLVGLVQEDGGIYKKRTGLIRKKGGLSVYNTAVCMTALHSHDERTYSKIILNARKFMASGQLKGDSPGAGGFGYDQNPRGGRADLSNTGWALMAMRKTQSVEDLRPAESTRIDVDWEAAVKFLEQLQDQEKDDPVNYGGFGYARSGARGGTKKKKDGTVKLRGFGSMTYAGLESMIYAQVERDDPRVQSTLQWAGRHWSVDENPGMGNKGLFYYYNVLGKAMNASGIKELKDPEGKAIAWQKQIIEKLAAIQQKDGSWVNTNNQFWEGDPVLVTAYSILTMENALEK